MPKSDVYLQDNILGMKQYPNNHFKIAIVDPPYFSGPEQRKYYGREHSITGVKRVNYTISEKWLVPTTEYFDELFRVSKHQIIWGCNYFDYQFGSGRIVWDKVNQSNTFSDCEIAYCSKHNSVRLYRYMWNGMMQGKSMYQGHIMQGDKRFNEKRIHPTQKPVILYKWLMNTYCKEGDNILDTHVGSGSSRIAAYEMGHDFTGFEINPSHYKNQNHRYLTHTSQLHLFNER